MARVRPGDRSSISEEHSDVSEHLNKLRERLLDLTTRNRLLSFAHSAASCLRVVDELPDQLFRRLIECETLFFSSVPEPTDRELRQFYADGSQVPRDEVKAEKLTKPKAEVWAKFKGQSTDYELPVEVDDTERVKIHDDSFIQTILYPPDLERRLRKLRGDARTAIEESGVNMLYLSFGFLEWRDDRSAQDRSFLAPLLLLPLELKRTLRGRLVDYALSWTGEEIQQNLSLAKKLDRDFGLVLPEVEENETPDSYFNKVRAAVRQKPNWRVRRYVTLSLFNFGKLLLYLDLDPSRWPANGQITSHDLVRKVLGASEEGNSSWSGSAAEPIDHVYLDTELALVDRADSSQAEALKFALSGKSLVVQGPPGTGKSQTITNLIAAALAENKTVLFVSEKLAALEVVRRRLRELGLGEFCLELHSNKTRKLSLIKDLENRLAIDRKLPPASRIKQAKNEQLHLRSRIEQYVALLRSAVGKIDQSLSKVLFEAGKARLDVGELVKAISPPPSFDPTNIAQTDRTAAYRYFAEINDTVTSAGGADAMKRHPWQGVSTSKLLAPDSYEAARLAMEWARAANGLKLELEALEVFIGHRLESSLSSAERLLGLSERLQKAERFGKHLKTADWFCEQIESYVGAQLPRTGARYLLARKLVELAKSFPAAYEHLRGPWLYDERFETTIARIEKTCETVHREHHAASHSIDVKRKLKHSSAELKAAAEVLRSTSLLKSLSPRWREAKSVWNTYALAGRKIEPDHLEAFARFVDAYDGLESDIEAKDVFREAFHGAKTDTQGLREMRRWIEQVAENLDSPTLAGKLIVLEAATIATLTSGAKHNAFASVEACSELAASATGIETADSDTWTNYLSADFEPVLVEFLKACDSDYQWAPFIERASLFEAALQSHTAAFQKFADRTGLDYNSWFYGNPSDRLDDVIQRASSAGSSEDQLKNWLKVQALLDAAPDSACAEMARTALQGRYPVDRLKHIFCHFLYDGLARSCFEKQPELRALRGSNLDSLRDSFRSADEALMEIRRVDIAQRLTSRSIPQGQFSQRVSNLTEMHLIKNELSKQKRHILYGGLWNVPAALFNRSNPVS